MNLHLNRLLAATSGEPGCASEAVSVPVSIMERKGAEAVKKYLDVVSKSPMDPESEMVQPMGATADVPRLFMSNKPVPRRQLRLQRVLALLEAFLEDVMQQVSSLPLYQRRSLDILEALYTYLLASFNQQHAVVEVAYAVLLTLH